MADPIKCPPEQPTLLGGIVYPQETAAEVRSLGNAVRIFDADVQRALKDAEKFSDPDRLRAYAAAWAAWRTETLDFVERNKEWYNNLLNESEGMYQARVKLCELQDYRTEFQRLGGKPVAPSPTDPGGQPAPKPVQETLSTTTTLIAVAAGAWLIFQLVPKRR